MYSFSHDNLRCLAICNMCSSSAVLRHRLHSASFSRRTTVICDVNSGCNLACVYIQTSRRPGTNKAYIALSESQEFELVKATLGCQEHIRHPGELAHGCMIPTSERTQSYHFTTRLTPIWLGRAVWPRSKRSALRCFDIGFPRNRHSPASASLVTSRQS